MKELGWKAFWALLGLLQEITVMLLANMITKFDRLELRVNDQAEWKRVSEWRTEKLESDVVEIKTDLRNKISGRIGP